MEQPVVTIFSRDPELLNLLEKILKSKGLVMQENEDLFLFDSIAKENPEAIIMDLDGYEDETKIWKICEKVKQTPTAYPFPFILISAKNDENTKVRVLESGADCFMTKPLSELELVARIKAIARRTKGGMEMKMRAADLEINLDEHIVLKQGVQIKFTFIQFQLLYLLISRRPQVISRKEIRKIVWKNLPCDEGARTVDVHIKRLRKKLGEDRLPSRYIESVHNIGYRFIA